jgi:pimeloyl-ACP methyl ester carboxylesterase
LYPRIEKDWWQLARAGAVVRIHVRDMTSGETLAASVRGDYLIAAIGGYLIFEEFRVATPAILSELAHGEPIVDARSGIVPAALRLGSGITTIPKYGLGYLTVLCADAPMGIPQYGGHQICEALGVPFGGRRHVEPVSTAVPTLLLAARYDASSPPEWADLAARSMTAAQVVHVPGTGHVAHTQPHSRACVGAVIATFVRDPTRRPDTRCIDALGLPAFPEPPPASTTAVGRDSTAAEHTSDPTDVNTRGFRPGGIP